MHRIKEIASDPTRIGTVALELQRSSLREGGVISSALSPPQAPNAHPPARLE